MKKKNKEISTGMITVDNCESMIQDSFLKMENSIKEFSITIYKSIQLFMNNYKNYSEFFESDDYKENFKIPLKERTIRTYCNMGEFVVEFPKLITDKMSIEKIETIRNSVKEFPSLSVLCNGEEILKLDNTEKKREFILNSTVENLPVAVDSHLNLENSIQLQRDKLQAQKIVIEPKKQISENDIISIVINSDEIECILNSVIQDKEKVKSILSALKKKTNKKTAKK